ncbi:MAG: hypothetical protein RL309_640, partial [Verrucomicrobiota bacterium]
MKAIIGQGCQTKPIGGFGAPFERVLTTKNPRV